MTYTVGGLIAERPFRLQRIGHFGYHSPDIMGTIEFITRRLGLPISDTENFGHRVPQLDSHDATGFFCRCGADHHTVVIASQRLHDTLDPARAGLAVNQLSWQVGSLQEVIDSIPYFERHTKLRRVGRDAPGSNWHGYVYDPDGYVNEVFYGMEQIGWDGRSKPAAMYDRSFRTLPSLPQIAEYTEVDMALGRGEAGGGYRWHEDDPPQYNVDGILMPRPFKITRLGRAVLFVNDLERSVDFYQRVLGLKTTQVVKVKGADCVFLRVGQEHHSLTLLPQSIRAEMLPEADIAAAYGMAVSSYGQLRAAYRTLREQGFEELMLPAELSAGIHYGFWLKGPDRIAVQLYYGMDRVNLDGSAPSRTTFPAPASTWPETIEHGGPAWYDPPFMGPIA